MWFGEPRQCCVDPQKYTQCVKEARTNCHSGAATFQIQKASPSDMIPPGKIEGGKLRLGPAKMKLRLSFGGGGTVDLQLLHAGIRGDVSAKGIVDGALTGAIPRTEIKTKLAPMMALMLDSQYQGSVHGQQYQGDAQAAVRHQRGRDHLRSRGW